MNVVLTQKMPAKLWVGLVTVLLAIVTFGFANFSGLASHAAEDEMVFPTPEVETVLLETSAIRNWDRFSGRLSAVEQAEIRPLVGGTLQQVLFEEGARVEQGQLLFVIDPRPFQAAVDSARANLASAESDVELAKIEYERAVGLAQRNVISQSLRDNRQNDLKVAQARVDAAQADLDEAELDLEYAYVRAPISGHIGRAEITVGNVIEAGGNTPVLTTIVNLDRLYAEFDVDEQTYFRVSSDASVARASEAQASDSNSARQIPVNVSIGNDRSLSFHANLQAFDNHFDTGTGTIRARAIIENRAGLLVPGIFVNVDLGAVSEEPVLLLPERAINVSQDKRYVYIVDENNLVEYRNVTLGRAIEGSRVVLSGVSAGERVIVNGLQRVMPGAPVMVASN